MVLGMFLRHSAIYSILWAHVGEFFHYLLLFSLFFIHGNALYSYLLLILCFVRFLMVGFCHSFGNDSSPFHDLLQQWWWVFAILPLFSLFFFHGNALYSNLLLILCFLCYPVVGFCLGFRRLCSPFRNLLTPFCEQWWWVFCHFTSLLSMETRYILIFSSFSASFAIRW